MQNLCQNAPVVCTVSVPETVGFYLLGARMQLHLWWHSVGNIDRKRQFHALIAEKSSFAGFLVANLTQIRSTDPFLNKKYAYLRI